MLIALRHLAWGIEACIDRVSRVMAWFTLSAVLLETVIVVLRYYFNFGMIALQEGVVYMHVLYLSFGVGYCYLREQQVRVDFLMARMSLRVRAWISLIGNFLLLLPTSLWILWFTYDYVKASWNILEESPQAGGLPGLFLMKSLIPVIAISLTLLSISKGIHALFELVHGPDEKEATS